MTQLRARSGVTPITGEFTATRRAVVRERTANASHCALDQFMILLNNEKFSGTVTLGMTDGDIRTIKAEDRQPIDV